MSILRIIAVYSLFLAMPAMAQEEKEAIFGYRWGATLAAVKSSGVTVTKERGDGSIEVYSTSSAPKPVSDMERYMLYFSGGKLVKISAIGKTITSDLAGSAGKERFEFLSKALIDKYGTPSINHQKVGVKLFKEYDEFYQCLAYSGCGLWVVAFQNPTKVLSLELKGLRRGTGYLNIVAEAVPEWGQAVESRKASRSRSDSDAL